jgi:hypothetical protein
MNKETLRMQMLAGLITESQYKSKLEDIQESKLSPERQSILNNLIDEFYTSTNPDNDMENNRDPEEIINDIRNQFGDVIADQVNDGKYEMHFGREYSSLNFPSKEESRADKFSTPPRVTKQGKMHQQDINARKNFIKRGY